MVDRVFTPDLKKSFAGHETFTFRLFWLKKGFDQNAIFPEIFQSDEAVVKLGVGKNMVRSIRHWCLATGILSEDNPSTSKNLSPTWLGSCLLKDDGWDPYLEDEATLWLLHWILVSLGSRVPTWFWSFNEMHSFSFSKKSLHELVSEEIKKSGWNEISPVSISHDVDCFIHTYCQGEKESDITITCPLISLELIESNELGDYRFRVGSKPSLPKAIFAYALADFWNKRFLGNQVLDYQEIQSQAGSPALCFKLDNETILENLDQIEKSSCGQMIFQDTALVRQVIKKVDGLINTQAILESYYVRR